MGPAIPLYEPLESGLNDNIFISKSYDATSHFETTTGMFRYTVLHVFVTHPERADANLLPSLDDVRDIYRRAEGEELVVEGLREGTSLVGEE